MGDTFSIPDIFGDVFKQLEKILKSVVLLAEFVHRVVLVLLTDANMDKLLQAMESMIQIAFRLLEVFLDNIEPILEIFEKLVEFAVGLFERFVSNIDVILDNLDSVFELVEDIFTFIGELFASLVRFLNILPQFLLNSFEMGLKIGEMGNLLLLFVPALLIFFLTTIFIKRLEQRNK